MRPPLLRSSPLDQLVDLGGQHARLPHLGEDRRVYVTHAAAIRAVDRLDPRLHPPPDVVVEVDVTRSSIDKLAVYQQFGVPEVWRHDGERLRILLLGEDGYAEAPSSRTFPGLSAELLTRLLAEGRHTQEVSHGRGPP